MVANKDRVGKKAEEMKNNIDPEDEYLTSEELEEDDKSRIRKLKGSRPTDRDQSNNGKKKNRSIR